MRFPFQPALLRSLRSGYTRKDFAADLGAGLLVGVVALPLSMAFAIASNCKPEQGLFTAIIAGALISMLGGSRVQIGGPTGAFVVLCASAVSKYGYGGLALATLMALRALRVTGGGQLVDVSQQEALLLCEPYFELGHAYTGVERTRNGMPFPMTIVPATDGYLGVNVLTQTQWELLCAFSGRVDLLEDPRFETPADRAPHARELTETFAEWALRAKDGDLR